jgi:hypothetical protein
MGVNAQHRRWNKRGQAAKRLDRLQWLGAHGDKRHVSASVK